MIKLHKYIFYVMLIIALVTLGFFLGILAYGKVEIQQMGNYDLYNCIWNNAQMNGFNQHPMMIEKIQDECICFREHNYTNLIEVDCSK